MNILIVDDDINLLSNLKEALSQDLGVTTCQNVESAFEKISHQDFDVILSDHILAPSEINGFQFMRLIHSMKPNIPFILMSGVGDQNQKATTAQENGAWYLSKPTRPDEILETVKKAVIKKKLDNTNHTSDDPSSLRGTPRSNNISLFAPQPTRFFDMLSVSPKMVELFQYIQQTANTNTTILVQGESGTGKELIARAVHAASDRGKRGAPFIAINCSVLSENLLENELFGHIRGAFTGATQYKKGLFQEADGGTLFLDEVGDIPPSVQTKLLRVLQEKEFKPLGSNETIHVDVRVIAATNVNLYAAVVEKKFRVDLYYRLAVIKIFVPPLRERMEDIPVLVHHFIQKYSQENKKEIIGIETQAMEKLQSQTWVGNIRELENTIERAVALARGKFISYEDIFDPYFEQTTKEIAMNNPTQAITQDSIESMPSNNIPGIKIKSLRSEIDENVRHALRQALVQANNNRSLAAKMLGITRPCLYYKLKKYKLWLPKFPESIDEIQ